MANARAWPDPPIWMSLNYQQDEFSVDERLPTSPVNAGKRRTTHPSLRPSSLRAAAAASSSGARDDFEVSGSIHVSESAVLSTSSLSEPVSDVAASRQRRSEKLLARTRNSTCRALSTIDIRHLDVDFDDPKQTLGVGTVGSVHLARYEGATVVVKRIRMPLPPKELRNCPTTTAKLTEKLAQFASRLRRYEVVQHPNIVPLRGISITNHGGEQSALLVSDLMYGQSLADNLTSLRRANLSLDMHSILHVAVSLAGALRALHNANLAWSGVKPENVLLSERINPANPVLPTSANVCISDLGLADAVSDHLSDQSIVAQSTASQSLAYAFKSPESFEQPTPSSMNDAQMRDMYSVGCLLYYITTLRLPWADVPMSKVFSSLVMGKERPEWPVQGDPDYRADVPAEFVRLIDACWAHSPGERLNADMLFDQIVSIRNQLANQDNSTAQIEQRLRQKILDDSAESVHQILSKKSSAASEASTASPVIGESPSVGMQSSGDSREVFVGTLQQVESTTIIPDIPVGNAGTSPLTSPDQSRKSSTVSARGGPSNRKLSGPVAPPSVKPPTAMPGDRSVAQIVSSPVTAPPKFDESNDGPIESLFRRSREPSTDQDLRLDIPRPSSKNMDTKAQELSLFNSDEISNAPLLPEGQVSQPRLDETNVLSQDYADALAKAAFKFDAKGGEQRARAHPESLASGSVGTDSNNMSQLGLSSKTMAGFGLFESVGPNASHTQIASSMRRKRKDQIYQVLERAGAAYAELQRRESLKEGTPPGQRRREAKKKEEDKSKRWAEEQALLSITNLRNERRYSEIMRIMDEQSESETVCKAGLDAIEEAAMTDHVYKDLCDEGAIEKLHGAMSRFGEGNVEMCKSFCNSVSALCFWGNSVVDHKIRAAGIPSEIVTLMTHHHSDVSLLTTACNSLAVVARSSEESRKAVATLGGPLAVYRAMTRNLNTFKDIDLGRASLSAVEWIAKKNEAAAETLVEVAGLDAVSHTAEVFAGFTIEENILAALEAFAFYDDGRKAIITSNGLHALSALMLRRRDVAFSERCCVFIRSVAQWRDPKCEAAMLESSICERAVMTVKLSERSPGDEGGRLAFYASQAVMYLASFGLRTRERLRMTGALEAIIHLLRTRPSNPRVVTMATNALVELMKGDKTSQNEAERLGAVRLLINAAEMYKNEPSVYGAVSLTLGYFAGMRNGRIAPTDPLYPYMRYAGRTGPGGGANGQQAATQQQQPRRRWRFGVGGGERS